MKDELYNLLGQITDLEAEITSMIHVLNQLELSYDLDSQHEAVSCISIFRAWAKYLEIKTAAVRDSLDHYIIKTDLD